MLNLRLPLVDPSHYISRFSALLEFGDETHKVATDAVRLVQRFDRDWMTRGRRPAGICGAALLLAARMNNFRRSVEEIVQVVKIADTTLKKRLEEFKATPSGTLTLADFRNVWLEDEMDPPAFTKGKEKEEAERAAATQGSGDEEQAFQNAKMKRKTKAKEKEKKKRKGKRKRGEDEEDNAPPIIAQEDPNIDPLLQQSITDFIPEDPALTPTLRSLMDETLSSALAEEVTTFLQNPQGTMLGEALNEAEQRRLEQITVDDELLDLNEEELDRFILSEEEVKIKERVWVELNKEYLEAIAGKLIDEFSPFISANLWLHWNQSFAQWVFLVAKGDQESTSTAKSRKVRISLMSFFSHYLKYFYLKTKFLFIFSYLSIVSASQIKYPTTRCLNCGWWYCSRVRSKPPEEKP